MTSRKILIVYGTTHGQTAKIAQRMADLFTSIGDTVTIADVRKLPRALALRDFAGVLIGSPVSFDRHKRQVRRFVMAYRDALNVMPSAFFSVSGAAAGATDDDREQARRYVNAFLRKTGWRPPLTDAIAGAFSYTRYNPFLRWIATRAAARVGGPTDVSRDHELTDWNQVRHFVENFLAILPRVTPVRVARPAAVQKHAVAVGQAWHVPSSETVATL
jgi:menaquinone-dependent protoporphyrinogen oxidase